MNTKKIIATLAIPVISLFSIAFLNDYVKKNDVFVGYVVAKEYTPAHMSNQKATPVITASLIPAGSASAIRNAQPRMIAPKYTVWVANMHEVFEKDVDQRLFNSITLGQKIHLNRW